MGDGTFYPYRKWCGSNFYAFVIGLFQGMLLEQTYPPLIFEVKLIWQTNTSDHDRDGVSQFLEDLIMMENLFLTMIPMRMRIPNLIWDTDDDGDVFLPRMNLKMPITIGISIIWDKNI